MTNLKQAIFHLFKFPESEIIGGHSRLFRAFALTKISKWKSQKS